MPYDSDLHRSRSVGSIAAELPGATDVFRRFGIEFCCQGHVSLADAAMHLSLDLNALEAALAALDPTTEPEAPQETGALIAYILARYHTGHRRQLPELIALSRKVETVHVNHPKVPSGLGQTLRQFQAELEALMQEQEAKHFPALQQKTPEQLALALHSMRHDHNQHGFFLDQVDRLTDGCTLPPDACRSWQALYEGVAQFKVDLTNHIHLENNVLFPRFEATQIV